MGTVFDPYLATLYNNEGVRLAIEPPNSKYPKSWRTSDIVLMDNLGYGTPLLRPYRVAFAAEMKYFFDAVGSGKSARTDIHDGLKAPELAEAATLSCASNGLWSWMF
jgi:predicted dehydrogenase